MSKFSRIQKSTNAIAVAHAAQATFSKTGVALNGVLWQFKVKPTASADGAATITLNIIDSDGDTVYTKASITCSANVNQLTTLSGDTRVPLSGTYTVQIVFSANQTTTDNSVVVTLMTDRG